jgi:hypothetical protein
LPNFDTNEVLVLLKVWVLISENLFEMTIK